MKHPKARFILAALVAAATFAPVSLAIADEAGAIKERQKLMRDFGKGMKNASAMMQGKVDYDAAAISSLVKTMQDGAQVIPTLFPAGTDGDNALLQYGSESDALPAIWQNMDDFKARSVALAAAAKAAEASTGDKAAFGAVIGSIGKACKGCHETYKKPDEK